MKRQKGREHEHVEKKEMQTGAGREIGNTESNWVGWPLFSSLKSQSLGALGSAFTPYGVSTPM